MTMPKLLNRLVVVFGSVACAGLCVAQFGGMGGLGEMHYQNGEGGVGAGGGGGVPTQNCAPYGCIGSCDPRCKWPSDGKFEGRCIADGETLHEYASDDAGCINRSETMTQDVSGIKDSVTGYAMSGYWPGSTWFYMSGDPLSEGHAHGSNVYFTVYRLGEWVYGYNVSQSSNWVKYYPDGPHAVAQAAGGHNYNRYGQASVNWLNLILGACASGKMDGGDYVAMIEVKSGSHIIRSILLARWRMGPAKETRGSGGGWFYEFHDDEGHGLDDGSGDDIVQDGGDDQGDTGEEGNGDQAGGIDWGKQNVNQTSWWAQLGHRLWVPKEASLGAIRINTRKLVDWGPIGVGYELLRKAGEFVNAPGGAVTVPKLVGYHDGQFVSDEQVGPAEFEIVTVPEPGVVRTWLGIIVYIVGGVSVVWRALAQPEGGSSDDDDDAEADNDY